MNRRARYALWAACMILGLAGVAVTLATGNGVWLLLGIPAIVVALFWPGILGP